MGSVVVRAQGGKDYKKVTEREAGEERRRGLGEEEGERKTKRRREEEERKQRRGGEGKKGEAKKFIPTAGPKLFLSTV